MRRNPMLQAACLAICFAPAMMGARTSQAQAVAHVLDVHGQWRLDGNAAPVASGQALSAGARITATSNRPGDSITIVHDEDMSRQRVACDVSAANPCRNPVVVPGASGGITHSQFGGLVSATISVLLSQPPAIGTHYALTLTRGREKVQEIEAVVRLDPDQSITLPPAPDDMVAGQYSILIARAGEKPSPAPQTVQLTSEGTWRVISCDAPGLYEISISNTEGDHVADALLLVTTSAQFQSARDEFDAMKELASKWTGPEARTDEHLFLRAYLLQASQAGTSPP